MLRTAFDRPDPRAIPLQPFRIAFILRIGDVLERGANSRKTKNEWKPYFTYCFFSCSFTASLQLSLLKASFSPLAASKLATNTAVPRFFWSLASTCLLDAESSPRTGEWHITVSNNRQLWFYVFGFVGLGLCFLVSKNTILFQMATIANIRCYTLVRQSRVRTSDKPMSGLL